MPRTIPPITKKCTFDHVVNEFRKETIATDKFIKNVNAEQLIKVMKRLGLTKSSPYARIKMSAHLYSIVTIETAFKHLAKQHSLNFSLLEGLSRKARLGAKTEHAPKITVEQAIDKFRKQLSFADFFADLCMHSISHAMRRLGWVKPDTVSGQYSVTTIETAFKHLAKHPQLLEILQQEIYIKKGRNEVIKLKREKAGKDEILELTSQLTSQQKMLNAEMYKHKALLPEPTKTEKAPTKKSKPKSIEEAVQQGKHNAIMRRVAIANRRDAPEDGKKKSASGFMKQSPTGSGAIVHVSN